MIQVAGLLILHVLCIYFLRLLWKHKNEAVKRGTVLTKSGLVSRKRSPRWFAFSVWVDFVFLLTLYMGLILYSVWLLFE
jgi:hypothetical protein